MAQLPKYSPKGRAALEKQVADYQTLLDNLLKENPAFRPNTPIVISGKSETETKDITTRNPGPNDPGGSTDKWSKTTNEPQQVIGNTAGEEAVRKRHEDLISFIDKAREDLADDAKLSQRIPLGIEEGLDIASGQLGENLDTKRLRTFSDLLSGLGGGTPQQQAHAQLIKGLIPDDGYTFLRTLLPGARENPRLLATLMNTLNNTGVPGAGPVVNYDDLGDLVEQKEAFTPGGLKSGLQTAGAASVADIDTAAKRAEGQLSGMANKVNPAKRGMAQLEEGASRKIGHNRKMATIGGVLAAGSIAGGAAMWPTNETTKFNEKALKTLLGSSSVNMELYKTDPAMALGNAFGAYVDREFGRDKKKPQFARYDAMKKKYAQTIARLGEGTLKLTDTDEGLSGLRSDLAAFYAAAPGYEGYNSSNPIAFPYVSGTKPGVITMDKDMKNLARLKDATEFAAIED